MRSLARLAAFLFLLPLAAAAQDCPAPGWLRLDGERPAATAPGALIADVAQRDVARAKLEARHGK